jgi:hypothetical protein
MSVASSKEEFAKAAAGLPVYEGVDFDAEVICIEPIDAAYFRNNSKQRCIIRRANGRLYLASYD